MSINTILTSTKSFLSKHSPTILTTLGVSSMLTSTFLAAKATPKVCNSIKVYEKAMSEQNKEEYKATLYEKVKVTWKEYIPSILTGVTGIACIFGANHINKKRNALLTAAYTISESTLLKYKDKIVKDFGEEKAKQIDRNIREEIKKEKKEDVYHKLNEADDKHFIIVDSYSGLRMPKGTTLNKIDEVINQVNKIMNYDMYVSAEEWYDRLGFKNIPDCAKDVGWNLADGLIEITQNPSLDEDGVPVLKVSFIENPKHEYYNVS